MSAIISLLTAERDRLMAKENELQADLLSFPQGYLSHKAIRGHDYFYLQHREGAKVRSQLIKQNSLAETLAAMRRKKLVKEELRTVRAERKHIERVLAREKRLLAHGGFLSPRVSAKQAE